MVARGLRLTPDGVEWTVLPDSRTGRASPCAACRGPTFRLGAGGPEVSIEDLFADLRAGGLTPHPYGPEADGEVAARFVGVIAAAAASEAVSEGPAVSGLSVLPSGPAAPPMLGGLAVASAAGLSPEEQVKPNPTMGVNKGRFPPFDDTETVARYGSFEAAMWDIATIGGGVIRQMDGIDLLWNTLMPATEIPDPPGGLLFYGMVTAAKPEHQSAVIIPSIKGWAEWYWDNGPADADEMHYQRMALNVHAGEGASDYMKLCARRKTLGLLAFGDAVGQYLVMLEEVLGRRGLRLTDVFEVLETGNEMEVYWLNPKTLETIADGAHELARFHGALAAAIQWRTNAIPFKVGELAAWGVHSSWAPRLVWLRDAIRDFLPDVTTFLNDVSTGWGMFREYASQGVSWWRLLVDVLVSVAAPGLGEAVLTALLGAELTGFTLEHPSAVAIIADAQAVGWTPPWMDRGATFVTGTLVQEVGFHWFHFSAVAHEEYESDCPEYPTDDCQLAFDAGSFVQVVVDGVRAKLGVDLGWSVSAMGYPSNHPQNIVLEKADDQEAVYTNPQLQAASLVRMTLLFRALGAKRVLWHTHMSNVSRDYKKLPGDQAPAWLLYSGMGLRADIAHSEDEWTMEDGSYLGAHSAVPRPAWFAFRRLVWLLSTTKSVEQVYADQGVSILKLTATSRGFGSPYAVSAGLERYPHAFVFWVDPFASVKLARASIVWKGDGYRSYSLVPAVTPEEPGGFNLDEATAPVDAQGYALAESVDWGEGDEAGESVGSQSIRFTDADIRLGDLTILKVLSVAVKRSKEKTPGLAVLFIDGDLLSVDFTGLPPGLGAT